MWPAWLDTVPPGAALQPSDCRPAVQALLAVIDAQARALADSRQPDDELDAAAVAALGRAGLWRLTLPAEAGGLGASNREFCLCMRHLAWLGPAYAITAVPHLCISVKAVEHLAAPEWRKRVFDGVVNDAQLVVFAISEDRGSDLMAMQTRLWREPDGSLHLQGAKQWITNLGRARYAVIAARNGSGLPPGCTLLLLDLQHPAIERHLHAWPKRCAQGSPTGALYLNERVVDPAQLLGQPGKGLALFQSLLQPGRLGAAAALTGLAEAAAQASGPGRAGPLAGLQGSWHAIDHAAACLDHSTDPCHLPADVTGLCALVKQQSSVDAQQRIEELLDESRQQGFGPSPQLLRAQHAAGLFRLLKGPGEVICLQALASWLGRTLPRTGAAPWQARRWQWAAEIIRQSLARLSGAGGPLPAPALASHSWQTLALLHQCLALAQAPAAARARAWQRARAAAQRLRTTPPAHSPDEAST